MNPSRFCLCHCLWARSLWLPQGQLSCPLNDVVFGHLCSLWIVSLLCWLKPSYLHLLLLCHVLETGYIRFAISINLEFNVCCLLCWLCFSLEPLAILLFSLSFLIFLHVSYLGILYLLSCLQFPLIYVLVHPEHICYFCCMSYVHLFWLNGCHINKVLHWNIYKIYLSNFIDTYIPQYEHKSQ